MQSQKGQNDFCSFQSKPFNITVIQVYAPTSNAEEAEAEWFYEDLQEHLELRHKKRCPFHYKAAAAARSLQSCLTLCDPCNAKVGSQEIPRVTGKFGLGLENETEQRLEFCQKRALVIANILFQQHKRRFYTWTSSDGQYRNPIDYILCS